MDHSGSSPFDDTSEQFYQAVWEYAHAPWMGFMQIDPHGHLIIVKGTTRQHVAELLANYLPAAVQCNQSAVPLALWEQAWEDRDQMVRGLYGALRMRELSDGARESLQTLFSLIDLAHQGEWKLEG